MFLEMHSKKEAIMLGIGRFLYNEKNEKITLGVGCMWPWFGLRATNENAPLAG